MSQKFITSRQFAPLFITQALAAFNDNFLKNTLVFLILFQVASSGLDASSAAALITLSGAIFMAPFLLLSALGGEMADKFDKATMTKNLKLAEIASAAVSVTGFYFHSIPILMTALFLFGVGSALFGPIKYGILPDLLPRKDLAKANAWIEGATFAAILGGTIAAGTAFTTGPTGVFVFSALIMGLSVLCYVASLYIPKTGSASPSLQIDKNFARSTWTLVKELNSDKRLLVTALMVSWFWLVGSIALAVLPTLITTNLGGSELAISSYLAIFAVAVALGSAVSAWMVSGRIVLLPAPVGSLIAGLFAIDLGITASTATSVATASLYEFMTQEGSIRIAIDLAGMAFFGAMIVVPTFAALQAWAPADRRARMVAAANVISAAFMTVGGGLTAVFQSAGASITVICVSLGVASIVAAGLMIRYLPTNIFRDFITILFRAFHRLEIVGAENLDKAGECPILALNHVSFLDGPLALALTEREPVFAIDYNIAKRWWVKPFLKFCNAMPLDPSKPMATRTLIRAVEGGDPLVIFPEGRISVTGSLMKVYSGSAMVADKTGSKIVPIRIEGLERSYFSRLKSSQIKKTLFPKVKVTILEPVNLEIDPDLRGRNRRNTAGNELYSIMSDLVFKTSQSDDTILEQIIKQGKAHGMGKIAVQDPVTGSLSYGKLLTGASILGRKFLAMFPNEQTIGVMLPNANGAAATLLGVMSAGKLPAMINFTAGVANILAACTAAEVKTILTSRAFITQAKLDTLVDELTKSVRIVYLDDVRETVTTLDKIKGLLLKTKPLVQVSADNPAVILFTSGSEGTPKGVVLTHRNVLANAVQAAARIDFNTGDKVFNVLPLFHSFGLTAGLVLPLVSGVPVYLYPSPLHYRIIPELIYGSNATIIFGTDTFLSGYARSAHPYDLRSIRYCFAGAEPVKASTRETYLEKFGIRILEGYGVTEAAPVVALNTPMYNRSGTVGKIMPGMETRLEAVPGVTEGGRLFIKGPNIMAGYMKAETPGILIPTEDGWHDTGDIVTIDAEGFIRIVGRAKRFAKIGGEMISLAAVEAIAGEFWPGTLSAVASLKDERKGEKLILITEAEDATKTAFQQFAKSKGATELSVPAEVHIAKVPVLGSGKIDFVGVTNLAKELTASR